MKLNRFQRQEVLQRWSPWLSSRLQYYGKTKAQLAADLARIEHFDDDPRSLVSGWLNKRVAVSSERAWTVGRVLARYSSEDSGLIALYASAWYGRLVALLARLSLIRDGREPAVALYALLPSAVEALPNDPAPYDVLGKMARRECASYVRKHGELIQATWQDKSSGVFPPKASDYARMAHEILTANVDREKALRWAWDMLANWAREIDSLTLDKLMRAQVTSELDLFCLDPTLLRSQIQKTRAKSHQQQTKEQGK